MSLTLAALLHRADLGLQLRVGDASLKLTWVHISDLADPTPYLQPGCMLLTTGLSIGDGTDEWASYVAALRKVGVPALGFGVGLRHRQIPPALLAAAAEQGLSLVEVPEKTRFSEVIHAVVQIGARQDRVHHELVLDRHRELLTAALQPPAHRSLVARLQEQLGGWVLLLGREGQVTAAAPDDARRFAGQIRDQLQRRASSARFEIEGEPVTTLPVGRGPRAGWLSVGGSSPLLASERSVVDATVSLLQLDVARAAELLEAERRERGAVLDLVVEGESVVAARVAEKLGVALPDGPVRVAIFSGASADLLEAFEGERTLQLGSALISAAEGGSLIAIVPAGPDDLAGLTGLLAEAPGSRGVVSESLDLAEVSSVVARLAARISTSPVGELTPARDVDGEGLVAQLDAGAGRGWAESLLAPLQNADGRVDLIQTVRTFLANNGSNEAAAGALGIHRRSLSYRLRKAERVLDRSLSDPTTRAELWIAFELRAGRDSSTHRA